MNNLLLILILQSVVFIMKVFLMHVWDSMTRHTHISRWWWLSRNQYFWMGEFSHLATIWLLPNAL